ncbi:MAG: molybdate ABC transporter substrate-binding protein [Blastocatellia bacterium]|nr:MAG: molybdate ABC transporter substrate-binding protein [Blastocatellia bacterium]
MKRTLLIALLFLSACKHSNNALPITNNELTVAAAADLTPAFEEIGRQFQSATGTRVIFSFGSTGLLTRQIENGAPMDVFAAANVDYINELESKGLILNDTKAIYARGRIVLWTTKDSNVHVDKVSDLTKPEVKRIAIANPDHAPYGMAAREALQSAGIWETVNSKLVFGDNIRQTLQYAETGNVEVAIVALSLAKQSDGRWTLIPENLHKPLDQAVAVIKGTHQEREARAFVTFIAGAMGRSILTKYGFTFSSGGN